MRYHVVSLPETLAEEARQTGRAPTYGHPVHHEVSSGYGPCRVCLEPFEVGEDRRLLFTYDPFRGSEPFPLPGPIFVHEDSCRPYPRVHRFPESLRFIPMTLSGYQTGRKLIDAIRVDANGEIDLALARLLKRKGVEYIHVRNTEEGCFLFRIERE